MHGNCTVGTAVPRLFPFAQPRNIGQVDFDGHNEESSYLRRNSQNLHWSHVCVSNLPLYLKVAQEFYILSTPIEVQLELEFYIYLNRVDGKRFIPQPRLLLSSSP